MSSGRIDPFIFTQYHSFWTFKSSFSWLISTFPKVHQASENNVILSKSRKIFWRDPGALRSGSSNVHHIQQCRKMEPRGNLLLPWTWDQTSQVLQVGSDRCLLPLTAAVVLPFWELAVADAFITGSGHQSLRKVEGKGNLICKCSCVFSHCWSWSSSLCSPEDSWPGTGQELLREALCLSSSRLGILSLLHTPVLFPVQCPWSNSEKLFAERWKDFISKRLWLG